MVPRDLRDWAAVAEIIASIAVVLSLVYLGYEVRQNRIVLQANSRQNFASQDITYLATALDPSVVGRALSKLDEGEELTPLEHSQLVNRQHMNFRIFENAHYQYRKGTLESPEWSRYQAIIRALVCTREPAQAMWTAFNGTFVPEFRVEVNRIREHCS